LTNWIEQTNDQGRIPEPEEVAKNEGARSRRSEEEREEEGEVRRRNDEIRMRNDE
jgi:hypothetical protein